MSKQVLRFVSNNFYVFLGVLLGLYISFFLSSTLEPLCAPIKPLQTVKPIIARINPPKKLASDDPIKKNKLIRPRYYSTELGIREKLFVGIFSSEEKINSQAIHLNRTIGHLVDQIKFFITAQYKLKSRFNVSGLVGFTDTRAKYRPFQVVKYVGDNFVQDFDYYFFAQDHTFINGRKLLDLVKKISVSMDVYLGHPVADGSYCNLDSGIIISASVLKAMRDHLDWCVINAISDDHSENFGRCIYHSIGLNCQRDLQDQILTSFKIKHFELKEHLLELSQKNEFNDAITIQPILDGENFYLLNAYFLKQRLTSLKSSTDLLSEDLANETWPAGQRPGAKPSTRFDLPKQAYFNMTHMFAPDDFTNVKPHRTYDLKDINYVIEEIELRLKNEQPHYEFRRLVNGYRTFDLSRGLDYTFDLAFRDSTNGKEVIKRFEVCKPLGRVEFLPGVPFTTETSRVTIVLTVQEDELAIAMLFLTGYSMTIMDRKEKSFLMLVLLYQAESPAKGDDDVFYVIKKFAISTSNKYKNDDLKIAWVSIRLPVSPNPIKLEDFKWLDFAVVDLSLKKIGPDSLILVLDSYTNITGDFLNRVRLNTISNFQIFNPIPFRQYNPKITQSTNLEINKNNGHFDREEYKYIAFYGRDYIKARKKFQKILPIIRVDNDLSLLLAETYRTFNGNIFEMFVKNLPEIHAMRATEMGLLVRFHKDTSHSNKRQLFIANSAQLGRYILTHQSDFQKR